MKIRIKSQESRIKLFINFTFCASKRQALLIVAVLFFTATAGALLILTPTAFAQSPVPIGEKFGFGNITSLGQGTSQLVLPVFSVATSLVVVYFIFGAFKYLTSGGNKEELEGARRMITHAIIGFVILMMAFLVLQFILSSLFGIQFKLIG